MYEVRGARPVLAAPPSPTSREASGIRQRRSGSVPKPLGQESILFATTIQRRPPACAGAQRSVALARPAEQIAEAMASGRSPAAEAAQMGLDTDEAWGSALPRPTEPVEPRQGVDPLALAAAPVGGKDDEAAAEKFRKCNICSAKKAITCFDKKEYRCKECRSSKTAFDRRYEKKHGDSSLTQLKRDKKEYTGRVAAFNALAPKDSTNYNRRSAENMGTLQLTNVVSATAGTLNYTECKMMWEREWLEKAQTTEFGNFTKEEAQRQWQVWLDNPDWPKDNDGPRGFRQCEVPIGKFRRRYDELKSGRELTGIEKNKKKASEDDAQQMFASLTAGAESMGGRMESTIEDAMKKMQHRSRGSMSAAFSGDADWGLHGSAFDFEGLMMPDMDDLLTEMEAKKARKSARGDDEEGDDAKDKAKDAAPP